MKKRNALGLCFILSGIGLILFFCLPSLKDYITYKKLQYLYQTIETDRPVLYSSLSQISPFTFNVEAEPTPASSPVSSPQILSQYEHLLPINSEIVGWITIDDTPINYPILQHEDNTFYLENDLYQTPSIYGSIYIDYRNNPLFEDFNTLIYGHNMNNGSMFHDLLKFKEADFFENHPYIQLSTLYTHHTYEVFAVYIVDADVETVEVYYEDETAFFDYLKHCLSRSLFQRSLTLNPTDSIITLVTCSYELPNARTIVQARRLSS